MVDRWVRDNLVRISLLKTPWLEVLSGDRSPRTTAILAIPSPTKRRRQVRPVPEFSGHHGFGEFCLAPTGARGSPLS